MMNEEATGHVLMVVATRLGADSVVSPTERRTSSTWPVSQRMKGIIREMKGSCLSDAGKDEKRKERKTEGREERREQWAPWKAVWIS